jgi:hypothetical protein
MISGNMVGSYSQMGKTFILVDEDGNEITGVCVDNPVVFTAGDNDVREGMVYASDSGVSTGSKFIPPYYVSEGAVVITPGKAFKISSLNYYDYTKLQAMICAFNTSLSDSVATEKVAINGNIYATNSTETVSVITEDSENSAIDFGITNDSGKIRIIRFFTYKEVY